MTENTLLLLGWAEKQTRLSSDGITDELSDLNIQERDWVAFLPSGLVDLWPVLSADARLVAFCFAYQACSEFDGTTLL
jgi:hypothetical protein